MQKDCSCDICVNACESIPGIFAPGEAQKAAKFLGMTWSNFKKLLMIDYYTLPNGRKLYYFTPRKGGIEEDREIASWGYAWKSGTCVFLKDKRCSIHSVKPMECRLAMCCNPSQKSNKSKVIDLWKKAGNPIRKMMMKRVKRFVGEE